jgi:hypothetical protein
VGTFHSDAHELHGITCVVATHGPRTWIGRVDTIDARGVLLRDADLHDAAAGGPGREEFLAKAAAFGHWPRHPHVVVPVEDVVSVTRLRDVAKG